MQKCTADVLLDSEMLKAFAQGTGVQYPHLHLKMYKGPSSKAQKEIKRIGQREKTKTQKPLIRQYYYLERILKAPHNNRV